MNVSMGLAKDNIFCKSVQVLQNRRNYSGLRLLHLKTNSMKMSTPSGLFAVFCIFSYVWRRRRRFGWVLCMPIGEEGGAAATGGTEGLVQTCWQLSYGIEALFNNVHPQTGYVYFLSYSIRHHIVHLQCL